MTTLFWILALLLAYSYVGYGLLLIALAALKRPANGGSVRSVDPIIVGMATKQVAELHQAMLAERAQSAHLDRYRQEMAELQRDQTAVLMQLVEQSKRQADAMVQVNLRAARAHDRGLTP